jgi:nucleotide-binding universal stress UspA family protein
MPIKIVVPTDFSANSKAGIRFAAQLASQSMSSIVFYHCMELLKPTRWTNGQYNTYVKKQLEATRQQLVQFVEKVYEQSGIKKAKFECVVEKGADPKKSLIKFAVKVNAGAICMATRGAGKIKKMIGTNSSGVLATSPVPVFVIPNGYKKATPITTTLYASDLEDLKRELKTVSDFGTPLNSNIYVYHYNEAVEEPETKRRLLLVQNKNTKYGVSFVFQKYSDRNSFAEHLEDDLKNRKLPWVYCSRIRNAVGLTGYSNPADPRKCRSTRKYRFSFSRRLSQRAFSTSATCDRGVNRSPSEACNVS